MTLVTKFSQIEKNSYAFLDAVHDGQLSRDRARQILSAGWVYYPIRYGEKLAFVPAKFLGYAGNSISRYNETVVSRNGGRARTAITRVLGYDAVRSPELANQLKNYCLQLGVDLQKKHHSFWMTEAATHFVASDRSAIRDYDISNIGNDDPEYRRRMAGSYERDENVRRAVLERASGRCEYCGQEGFLARNGKPFLEAHHIISLSEQGPDKVSNVIALCPNDHRRAHFGEDWAELQDKFQEILAAL